jgi:predicted translin family RNA/ssDNA-binding protein
VIYFQAVDYDNARSRQGMEDQIAEMRESMDRINALNRHVMKNAANNLNELNRQAMEHTGEQLRQTMENVKELNRNRQAFVNAQQQMMAQFQEKANAEGDPVKMARLIIKLNGDGISLVS